MPDDPRAAFREQQQETAIKDHLWRVQQRAVALGDAELEIELNYVGQRLEVLRLDIDNYKRGNRPRVAGWYQRAGYAAAMLESELRLFRAESDRRRAERHTSTMAEQQRARIVRDAAQQSREKRFIRHASKVLPKETWQALWAAVDAEEQQP